VVCVPFITTRLTKAVRGLGTAATVFRRGSRGLQTSAQIDLIAARRASDASPSVRTHAMKENVMLIYFNEVDKGRHFAARKQPNLFSAELRAAFNSPRNLG
jgi:hypothetical protein